MQQTSFSVNKYGAEQAFALAVEACKKMLEPVHGHYLLSPVAKEVAWLAESEDDATRHRCNHVSEGIVHWNNVVMPGKIHSEDQPLAVAESFGNDGPETFYKAALCGHTPNNYSSTARLAGHAVAKR